MGWGWGSGKREEEGEERGVLFPPFLLHVVFCKKKGVGGGFCGLVTVGKWGKKIIIKYIYTYTTMGKEINGCFLRHGICQFFFFFLNFRREKKSRGLYDTYGWFFRGDGMYDMYDM